MLNSSVNILAEYSFIFRQDIQQLYFIITFTSVFLRSDALSCASSNAGRKGSLFNVDVGIEQNPVSDPKKAGASLTFAYQLTCKLTKTSLYRPQ